MTTRKHGTKPNLKAQRRNSARRSPQAHALEGKQYRHRVVPDGRAVRDFARERWNKLAENTTWETPEHEAHRAEYAPKADCDCCGKYRELTFSVSYGMDTWACDECRGGLPILDPAPVPEYVPQVSYPAEARVFGTRESGDRDELVWEKARDDARSRDPDDVV